MGTRSSENEATRAATSPATRSEDAAHPPSPVLVLVVEDDRAVTRMLRLALRAGGFSVLEVRTGVEATEALERQSIDAVILDLGLPNGRSDAVLYWLRNRGRSVTNAPAWVVTSALDLSDVVKRYGRVDEHFVAKPFNPWELVQALNRQLAARGAP